MKERLKEMRKALGLKQTDIAQTLGVSNGNVGDWERGKAKPGADALAAIVKQYPISALWLLTGEGHMFIDSMESEGTKTDCWQLNDFQREAAAPLFPILTEEQVALIDNYAKLNRRDQAEIRLLIQHKIAEYENKEYEAPIQKGLSSHSPPLRGKQGGSQTA